MRGEREGCGSAMRGDRMKEKIEKGEGGSEKKVKRKGGRE